MDGKTSGWVSASNLDKGDGSAAESAAVSGLQCGQGSNQATKKVGRRVGKGSAPRIQGTTGAAADRLELVDTEFWASRQAFEE